MKLEHGLLALAMMITGALNTLLLKAQDRYCISNCDVNSNDTVADAHVPEVISFEDEDKPKAEHWEQPVIQALFMFLGESFCLIAFHIVKAINRNKNKAEENERKPLLDEEHRNIQNNSEENGIVNEEATDKRIPLTFKTRFLFFVPTLLDLAATSVMNYGLILVAASVYQMLRGAVVLFTAIFSILFLRRRLVGHHWLGLFLVVGGIVLVGLAPNIINGFSGSDSNSFLGVILVIAAQMFTACQFVFEEKVLHKYFAPPLEAVGYEGIFGLISVAILAPILYFAAGDVDVIFNLKLGFEQFIAHPEIYGPGIGSIFTIAFFNFFGLAITREVSATARSTIDSTRTVVIWAVSLAIGWEIFLWPQIIGFVLLVTGTFIYNEIITAKGCRNLWYKITCRGIPAEK